MSFCELVAQVALKMDHYVQLLKKSITIVIMIHKFLQQQGSFLLSFGHWTSPNLEAAVPMSIQMVPCDDCS